MDESTLKKLMTDARCSARLTPERVGEMLGFQKEDVPVLIRHRLLEPLGNPKPNAVKYFSLGSVLDRAVDSKWLDKATQAIYDHWHAKNQKRGDGGG